MKNKKTQSIDLEKVVFLDISDSVRKYYIEKKWVVHYPECQKIALTYGEEIKEIFRHNMYDFFSWQKACALSQKWLPTEIDYIDMSYEGKDIVLPEKYKNRLIDYLQTPKLWSQWSRHQFVEKITGNIVNLFQMQDYSKEKEYRIWSSSYVVDELDNITQSHIYLGENLFLGKSGSVWPLIISSAEEQEKLWDGVKTKIIPLS